MTCSFCIVSPSQFMQTDPHTGRTRARPAFGSCQRGGDMDINRFTEKAQEALVEAQSWPAATASSRSTSSTCCSPCSNRSRAWPPSILRKADVDVDGLRRRARAASWSGCRKVSGGGGQDQVYVTGRLNRAARPRPRTRRRSFKDDYVSVEHLLLAMIDDTGAAGRLLKEAGVTRDTLMTALQEVRGNQRVTIAEPRSDLRGPGEVRPRPDPAGRARTSSTRSSAATRRSAASSRCCRGAPRTTPC